MRLSSAPSRQPWTPLLGIRRDLHFVTLCVCTLRTTVYARRQGPRRGEWGLEASPGVVSVAICRGGETAVDASRPCGNGWPSAPLEGSGAPGGRLRGKMPSPQGRVSRSSTPGTRTLGWALERASSRNPALEAARSRYLAMRERPRFEGSLPDPTVGVRYH